MIERRLLDQVADGHVTAAEMNLLKLVGTTDSYTLGDVAAFLRVSNPGASKAVDRLVRRDLLRRTEDSQDRRVIHLHLTQTSRRLLHAYGNARRRTLRGIFAQFSPEELRCASALLDRLSDDIVYHPANSGELCVKCGIYFRERCLLRQRVPGDCFYERTRKKKRGKE